MVELPFITVLLVTIASALYVVDWCKMQLIRDSNQRMDRVVKQLEEIHESAHREIDDVSFDFWWSDIEKGVRQAFITRHVIIPDDVREMMLDEELDNMIAPSIDSLRSMARHVAVHARMGVKEAALVKRQPKKVREAVQAALDAHEAELNHQRQLLAGVGVDVTALENHFSS